MTRKHYQLVADSLRDVLLVKLSNTTLPSARTSPQKEFRREDYAQTMQAMKQTVHTLAFRFKEDNPRFDRSKFQAAVFEGLPAPGSHLNLWIRTRPPMPK